MFQYHKTVQLSSGNEHDVIQGHGNIRMIILGNNHENLKALRALIEYISE